MGEEVVRPVQPGVFQQAALSSLTPSQRSSLQADCHLLCAAVLVLCIEQQLLMLSIPELGTWLCTEPHPAVLTHFLHPIAIVEHNNR